MVLYKLAFRNNKGLSLSDQVDSALNDLFNLDSLTAQIKAVVSGHEHTVELLVALQEDLPLPRATETVHSSSTWYSSQLR